MASFGEGLSKAFTDTYGALTRGAYYNALTNKMAREAEGDAAFRADYAEAEKLRDGGAAKPMGAVGQIVGQPVAQQAPAPQAPTQPPGPSPLAVVANPPVAPQAPQPAAAPAPQAAPPQAAAPTPGAAPAAAPGAVAASMAQPAASAQPTAPQPSAAGGQEGGQAPFDQPTMQRIFKLVEDAKDPVTTMVAAGAMEFARNPPTPEQRAEARAQVSGLVAALHDARSGGEGRPIGKQDWNAFYDKLSQSALKNLSGPQQTAALANIDRIRTQGLTDRLSVAMAAASTGDFNGAAAALSAADGFLPDGQRRTFKAVPGGVEMTSQPEDGKGAATKQVLTPADMEKYGATLLNPLKSMEHFLNVRKQNEVERHNKTDEGLRGAALAQSASQHADNKKLAWERLGVDKERLDLEKAAKTQTMELKAGDQAGASAWLANRRAQDELADARDSGDQTKIEAAAEKVKTTQAAMEESSTKMTREGIVALEGLELRAERVRNQAELVRLNAKGKAPLDATTLKTFYESYSAFKDTNADPKGKVTDPAANFALGQSLEYAQANRNYPPEAIMGALERFYKSAPPDKRANPPAVIVDSTTGMRLVRSGVDRSAIGRATGSGAAAQGALPQAGAETPAAPASMRGATRPPPPRPYDADQRTPTQRRRDEDRSALRRALESRGQTPDRMAQ